jgi:hypothetical protein
MIIGAPSSHCASTSFSTRNGSTIKIETWIYDTGALEVIKYWKADKLDCESCDTSHFKPDSTWVYFDKTKDTIRVDTYKNGKLINQRKTLKK